MTDKPINFSPHTHNHTVTGSKLRSESGAWPGPPTLVNTIGVGCKCHWVIHITQPPQLETRSYVTLAAKKDGQFTTQTQSSHTP